MTIALPLGCFPTLLETWQWNIWPEQCNFIWLLLPPLVSSSLQATLYRFSSWRGGRHGPLASPGLPVGQNLNICHSSALSHEWFSSGPQETLLCILAPWVVEVQLAPRAHESAVFFLPAPCALSELLPQANTFSLWTLNIAGKSQALQIPESTSQAALVALLTPGL